MGIIRLWAPSQEGTGFSLDVRFSELTSAQVRMLLKRYNWYAWVAVKQAKKAESPEERQWWYGKAGGLLDAIMMLDGSYEDIEEFPEEDEEEL